MKPSDRSSKRRFFDAYKRTIGCTDCGTSEGVLEFDHRVKSTKRFKVGASMCYPLATLLDEADKCDIRCKRCHAIRHHRDDQRFDPDYCPRGHARHIYGFFDSRGHRQCKECRRISKRRLRATKRQVVA